MRTVVICGNSLVLSSIRASLEQRTGLQLFAYDAAMPAAADRLSELQPDAIIFDLASMQSDSTVGLWKAQPNVLLIGVDVTAGKALVLSGHSCRALTPEDLMHVIETGAHAETKEPARSKEGEL